MTDQPDETNNQNSVAATDQPAYEVGQIRPKSVKICYLLCLFFGVIGIHKIYLDKTGKAGLYMILLFFSAIAGWPFLLVLGVFLVQDLLSIPLQVRLYNEELPDKLRRQREHQLQHKR